MKSIRRWVPGLLALAAIVVGAWWFMQQTASYRALDAMLRSHPAVAAEVGQVTAIKLPLFGYGLDWTDAKVDPRFDVRVVGSTGQIQAHADFRQGVITDAWMRTPDGGTVPLAVRD